MATTAIHQNVLLDTIVREMASGVDKAVECWMAQIEQIFNDTRLTTLGRMNAIHEVVQRYKQLTGKDHLAPRTEQFTPGR
jgi:acetyl-CoA carboxylase alpha subunit